MRSTTETIRFFGRCVRAGTLWAVVVIACTDDAADPSGGGPDAGNPIVLDAAAPDAGTGSPDAGFADLGAPADAGAGPCAVADIRYELGLRYARVPGVDPNLLSLDLALPVQAAECPAPPLVVYVHGGGWRTGDKRGANVGAAVQAFVSAGYAFATVNYRLSPAEFSNDPNRVMYPTHNQDVATAIAWLIEQADEYGYRSSRIRLYGFSAGAGIVSAVATNERFLREVGRDLTDIGCVASLDTEGYDVARQAETEGLGGLYRNAFGDDPAVWAEASPINHLAPGKGIPPFLIVVRGTLSRIQLSREFADGLYAAGADARVLETTDFVHEDVGRSVGEAEDLRITPAILSLFDDCRFSADPAALRALETLTYRWSFRPGRDPNDRPTHATEVNALVAHAGRLFATIGVRNLIQPDGVPATGPQVLVKDGPDAPWRVEQTFGPAYVRSESMAELVITTDGAGDALSPPVRLLVAGVGQTEPPSSTVWTRDDAAGTWTRIVLDADPRRTGGAVAPGVRSLVVHRDPETGVDAVYAGTSAGRLFRGVYDAAAPGRLRFDTAPELTDRPGRVPTAWRRSTARCTRPRRSTTMSRAAASFGVRTAPTMPSLSPPTDSAVNTFGPTPIRRPVWAFGRSPRCERPGGPALGSSGRENSRGSSSGSFRPRGTPCSSSSTWPGTSYGNGVRSPVRQFRLHTTILRRSRTRIRAIGFAWQVCGWIIPKAIGRPTMGRIS